MLESVGVDIWRDSAIAATQGAGGLESVSVVPMNGRGSQRPVRELDCDFLAVSGGWNPALALYAHAGGRMRYDPASAAFVAADSLQHILLAGRVAGHHDADSCMLDGARAGHEAARICGHTHGDRTRAGAMSPKPEDSQPIALWSVPPLPGCTWDEHFVDIQRDATVADIHRGVEAGLRSAEHIKRYTTIGTGNDQGKTSVVNALGILAEAIGASLDELAPTTSRPPVSPTPFNVLAAHERGPLYDPAQLSPLHRWHVSHGAVFDNSGRWRRPRFFPQGDEDQDAASARECLLVRSAVGLADISTLGKIDVHGPDAAEFLDRMYTNLMSSLAIGSCRYGVLCGADGMIFDDGVVTRLGDARFLATTTTGNAAAVFGHFEHWRQNEWPDLRVHLTRVTDHWAAFAIAGPRSRQVLDRITQDVELDNESFPFLTMRDGAVAGVQTRLFRVSFSGELSFEVHVPARFAVPVWDSILEAGADYGIAPYGTEAMHVLRAEKGYIVVGQDTDGTITPQDAGLGWLVNSGKPFFVGKRSHSRPDVVRTDRLQLVGILPDATDCLLREGAQILAGDTNGKSSAGHVTSSYRSSTLGRPFALGLMAGGRGRHGERVLIPVEGAVWKAQVTAPLFYDPEGARRDGD
jgi:sarcosine oxidase subunit alpha